MKNKIGILFVGVLVAIAIWSLIPRPGSQRLPEFEEDQPALDQERERDRALSAVTTVHRDGEPGNDPVVNRQREREGAINRSLDEWRTPIEFYGRILDELGNGVPDVGVTFGVTDLSQEGHSSYQTESDANGLFALRGVSGKHLSVRLHKPGYYVSQANQRSFFFAGNNENFIPNARLPVIFHLRRHGQAEALIRFHRSFQVPRDGTPVLIDLTTGRQGAASGATFQVECWTGAPLASGQKYDWRCRVSVPGGGLQINDQEFGFEAPLSGYVDSDLIDMAVAGAERWQSDVTRSYFLRTADGRYGRLSFRMIATGDHFCQIESFLNPGGSRNLEPMENNPPQRFLPPGMTESIPDFGK